MTVQNKTSYGLTIAFNVTVDGLELGDWSACSGLDITTKLHKEHNPGEYTTEQILFADVSYGTVKLKRAMDRNSANVRRWVLDRFAYYRQPAWNPLGRFIGGETAVITLLDAGRRPVTTWQLRNVYPVGLKGPDMSATTSAVATETLEIAHEGFMS